MIGNGNTAVGNTVNFTCNTGFIFDNNATSVNTTCMADGNWTEDLTGAACERKHNSIVSTTFTTTFTATYDSKRNTIASPTFTITT